MSYLILSSNNLLLLIIRVISLKLNNPPLLSRSRSAGVFIWTLIYLFPQVGELLSACRVDPKRGAKKGEIHSYVESLHYLTRVLSVEVQSEHFFRVFFIANNFKIILFWRILTAPFY